MLLPRGERRPPATVPARPCPRRRIGAPDTADSAAPAPPVTRGGAWPWLGLAASSWATSPPGRSSSASRARPSRPGGQTLLDALDTEANATLWRVSSGLGYLGAGCLVWFGAGLRRLLEERAAGPGARAGAGAGAAARRGLRVVRGHGRGAGRRLRLPGPGLRRPGRRRRRPSAHVAINRLSQDPGLAAWAGLGLAAAASAVGGLREGLLPAWLGWLSAVVAVLIVLLCLAGLAFPANLPAGLWLLVTALWSIRRVR